MYELLIVDDEVHIAAGIEASVDWGKLGVAGTHVVHNIRQAKQVMTDRPIDILVCDIEMPEGDGFDLLRWVREHRPAVKSVFLTCHADFAYAQQAIRLGSLDYLLKPVVPEKLEEVVGKAIEEVEKDREADRFGRMYERYRRLWSAHQPVLVERFWLDVLGQTLTSRKDIEARRSSLGLDEGASVTPVYIGVQRWQKRLTDREEQIMEYALKNAAEEMLLAEGCEGEIVSTSRGAIVAFLRSSRGVTEQALADRCEAYIRACNEYLYCHLCCYLGKPTPLHDVRDTVTKLEAANRNNVLHHDRVFPWVDDGPSTAAPERPAPPRMMLWSELLLRLEERKLLEEIAAYLETWRHAHGVDRVLLQAFYQDVLQMAFFALKKKGLFSYAAFSDAASLERIEAAGRSLMGLREAVEELVRLAAERLRSLEREQSPAEKMKRFIAEHLDRELSRQDLADHFGLSPDYLVKVFKKETGMSVSEYILKERIDNAVGLLTRTDIPVSEISLLAGYSNFSYFSKVFKKATGYNPQEYRKMHRR